MEIRKLQKIKGGSFTVSLPKDWVEKRKLKSGEQLTVLEEEDGSLRLFPFSTALSENLEVTLELENFNSVRALEYCIGTYYMQGSNKINIISKKTIPAEHKKRLKLLRIELPGVEVAEEEANKLSFQVIIDPATFSLDTLISKTSAFSLRLQEDAIKSLLEQDFQLAAEVLERSREALRHYRMTIRQIALASISRLIAKKIGIKNCQECVTFALTARDLNRLVHHSSSIAKHVLALKNKRKISKEILGILEEMSKTAYEMQEKAVRAFLEKNVQLAITVMGKMNAVREKEEAFLKAVMEKVKDVDAAVVLGMIARDLRRIAGYAVAVSDNAMNRVLTPT
ncbi:MAG: phosphate uptake regulator PhoU [Candidatus Bathyarchaeia archaeon]